MKDQAAQARSVKAITIPVIDVSAGDDPCVFSARVQPERLAMLLQSARRSYTAPGLAAADRLSRAWATQADGDYLRSVREVGRLMGRRGAFLLNHSYEWGCSSAATADALEGGNTLLRTLDWPFNGLDRALIVTRWDGGAGRYASITWPGVVGVLTGCAPGRFAACINQPPLPLPRWGRAVAWPAARWRVARSRAMSPTHLLRKAFDTCATFADGVAAITTTPLCIPAIFTLAGPGASDAVVIERTMDQAYVPTRPVAANHWASPMAPPGRPRNPSSHGRHAAMDRLTDQAPDWTFSWLGAPVAQPDTRVAVMANPHSGRLLVQGWESSGPVTEMLDVRCQA